MRAYEVLPLVGAGTLLFAHLLAATTFRRRTDAIIARLGGANAAEIRELPIPALIQSFVHRAVSNIPVPKTVRLSQSGDMRAHPGDSWRSFTAEQTISVHEPGFVWLARMRVAPLLLAHILDSYVDDVGLLEVRLLGSLRVARAAGQQINRGELMRYLAELAWAPHAILYNPHLSWREIDTTTVEASAESTDGTARVRLVFENGDITRIEADDRPRAVDASTIPTPWQGRFFDYREMEGCRIPMCAVVSWLFEDGPFDCWRGQVTEYHLIQNS